MYRRLCLRVGAWERHAARHGEGRRPHRHSGDCLHLPLRCDLQRRMRPLGASRLFYGRIANPMPKYRVATSGERDLNPLEADAICLRTRKSARRRRPRYPIMTTSCCGAEAGTEKQRHSALLSQHTRYAGMGRAALSSDRPFKPVFLK